MLYLLCLLECSKHKTVIYKNIIVYFTYLDVVKYLIKLSLIIWSAKLQVCFQRVYEL